MSLPKEFLARLEKQFGPGGLAATLEGFKAERPPTLRVNTLRSNDGAVMDVLRENAIQFERIKGVPHAFVIKNRDNEALLAHPLTTSGAVYLQGLTSMLPPIILDPQPQDRVLDLCAAPGSKTSQLAAMAPEASLVACEENDIRFQKLQHTLARQGATNVEARHVDATLLHHTMPEAFDRVLADVPCSAEGRIQLHEPRTYRYWSEKNIIAHAKLQRRLLRSAVACLKPGGILVYSTCTLAPEENEGMIAWLLAEYPNLKAVPVTLPFPSRPAGKGSVLLPTKLYEGFFVAKIQKME